MTNQVCKQFFSNNELQYTGQSHKARNIKIIFCQDEKFINLAITGLKARLIITFFQNKN